MSLLCSSCGYDNEPTRVYCHNCGEKLDRKDGPSALPGGFAPPQQGEVRRPSRRAGIAWSQLFSALIKLLLLLGLASVVTLALLPPHELPAPVQPDEKLSLRISDMIKSASKSGGVVAFDISAEDLNRWFVSNVHFKPPAGFASLRPERVYAVPGNGTLRIGLEAALPFPWHLFFEGDYAPVREGASYVLQPRRFSVGRLPLPVLLGWPVERQLDGLKDALAAPLGQLEQAAYIGVTPDRVTLRWAGRSR